jgi:hypothetical protein
MSAVLPLWTRADRCNMRPVGLRSDLHQRIEQSLSQWHRAVRSALHGKYRTSRLRGSSCDQKAGFLNTPLLSGKCRHGASNCSSTAAFKVLVTSLSYYYYYLYLLSLCRVFTIIYLKQTVSLGYTRVYNVTAILSLQFMVYVMLHPMLNVLYLYISTSRSTCAVPNMAVFCSPLMSCFICMVLRCVLNDFEMVPVAPSTTGTDITSVFIFHLSCISIAKPLYRCNFLGGEAKGANAPRNIFST